MKRSRFLGAIVATAIAFSPTMATATTPPPAVNHGGGASPIAVWFIMGCAASIIWSAWVANVTNNRQLTPAEVALCGLGYWLNRQQ